jgi:DNA mismatch repair protein PMS2
MILGGKRLQRLSTESARALSSTQVISSLASVVKELVDNAIDADASAIDVEFVGAGVESLTVGDNGSGIPIDDPAVLDSLVVARATSKRDAFIDQLEAAHRSAVDAGVPAVRLEHPAGEEGEEAAIAPRVEDVGTPSIGFRGEALHSIATVAALNVTTKTVSMPAALSVLYTIGGDQQGAVTKAVGFPHISGTQVQVRDLFSRVPVRRLQLEKQAKQQFSNAVAVLRQLAVAHPLVRFHVTSTMTAGQDTPRASSSVVFVTKGHGDVLGAVADVYGAKFATQLLKFKCDTTDFSVNALVSRVGEGRATADMQFYFLDGRPIDFPKLSTMINECFIAAHPSATNKVPVVFLTLTTKQRRTYDPNVAPNKRTAIFRDEAALLGATRRELLAFLTSALQSGPVGGVERMVSLSSESRLHLLAPKPTSATAVEVNDETPSVALPSQRTRSAAALQDLFSAASFSSLPTAAKSKPPGALDDAAEVVSSRSQPQFTTPPGAQAQTPARSGVGDNSVPAETSEPMVYPSLGNTPLRSASSGDLLVMTGCACGSHDDAQDAAGSVGQREEPLRRLSTSARVPKTTVLAVPHLDEWADLEPLRTAQLPPALATSSATLPTKGTQMTKRPRAWKPLTDANAEADLRSSFSRQDFERMEPLGQFNDGFIVGRVADDLFILDQHASDEKHTFERLRSQFHPKAQPLLQPVCVIADDDEREAAYAHREQLAQHGFRLVDPPAAAPGGAIYVSALPVLPYETVKADDVLELTHQLRNHGSITVPLRAVWHSLATKACRTSVMIGKPLDAAQMQRIVRNMSTMEHPWNCPHGRPTMRHIVTLRPSGGQDEGMSLTVPDLASALKRRRAERTTTTTIDD